MKQNVWCIRRGLFRKAREGGKEENEKMVTAMVKMNIKEKVARDLAGVKKEYLEATFKAINAQYGSMDQFLSKEMHLSVADIAVLKTKYTE